MAYGAPADPVAGTVITVAYAVANILDPIRALRTFTGGSDPPGSNYVVTSDSTSATSWKTMVSAVLGALGYTPVNKAGDSGLGDMTMASAKRLIFQQEAGDKVVYAAAGAYKVSVGSGSLEHQSDTTFRWRNDTDAAGTYAATLDADTKILTVTNRVSSLVLESTVATGTAPLNVTSTTQVNNLNAAQVAGKTPTATPGANALPLADATGKLDAWVSAAAVYAPRVGTVRAWAGHSSQLAAELASEGGWLECDGASYLRATYPALFTAFGGTSSPWGLPDGTHFNVPDFRDRSPVGKSGTRATGSTGGASTQNIQHQHASSGLSVTPGDSDDNHDMGGTGTGTNVARASHHHGTVGVSGTVDNGGTTSLSMYHPYVTTYMLIKI